MDPNLLKNLGLDSSLNANDIQLLQQILGSVGQGTNSKMPKMTAKERNNLVAKLSSNATLQEVPKKELKDMNEQEKKIYREELKQKLKNKQNEKKMMRTSNLAKQNKINNDTNYSDAIGKISEMIKNIDHNSLNNLTNQVENNIKTPEETNTKLNQTNVKQETIINNIINKTNETNKDNENNIDDLDDYIN